MRLTRLSWYLLVAGIGVVSAESLSWSTPVIFPLGFFPFLIYGLHYVLIMDYLVRRRALTVRSLAVGGLVLGLATESLMTKVIWNPPWEKEEAILRFLGLGVYEVWWICAIWHVWMSTAVPLALTMHYFGRAEMLSDRAARQILRALPLTVWFITGLGGGDPALLVVGVVLNTGGIMLLAWFYLRRMRSVSLPDLALTRWEQRGIWMLTVLFYLLMLPVRADAWPDAGPLILGLALLAGSIVFFVAIGRYEAGRMPPPGPVRYRAREFGRYAVYFLVKSLALMIVAILVRPVALGTDAVFILASGIVGNAYLIRLAWRVFRELSHGKTPSAAAAESIPPG